jgi:hypothetical protein
MRRIASIVSAAAAAALTMGALLASPAAAATSAAPAAARPTPVVTGGASLSPVASDNEQAVTFFVTVSGTPAPTGGVILLAGGRPICIITLANGSGSCPLPSMFFAPGTYQITASYGGDARYTIASGTFPLVVTAPPVPTVTTLTLSSPTIALADEHTETFTATVTNVIGTPIPTGTVRVEMLNGHSFTVLCMITVANGSGSCTMPASLTLPPGTNTELLGEYVQNSSFSRSATDLMTLTVTP